LHFKALQCRLVDEIIPEHTSTPTGNPSKLVAARPDQAAEDMLLELLHRIRREFKSEAGFEAVLESFCSSSRAASAGGHD